MLFMKILAHVSAKTDKQTKNNNNKNTHKGFKNFKLHFHWSFSNDTMAVKRLRTRQKRQILLTSLSVQLLDGNKQLYEVSEHKLLSVIIDNNLTWGPHKRDLCKPIAQRVYQSAEIKNLTFHARKTFSKPISSHV